LRRGLFIFQLIAEKFPVEKKKTAGKMFEYIFPGAGRKTSPS
jgi:hypothetical protein